MYRTIMVPTDGSEFSRHAIPFALALARPADAAIRLVGVFEPTFVAPVYGVGAYDAGVMGGMLLTPAPSDAEWRAQHEAQETALGAFATELAAATGLTVTAALESGGVADALRAHAEAQGVDLIVMATHGRGGLSRALLGSIANDVVRTVSCPVLLVRPHGDLPDDRQAAPIRHVLVPLDGSAASATIVDHAAEVAALTGASCTLLHAGRDELRPGIAVPDVIVDPDALHAEVESDAMYLEQHAARVRARSVAARTDVVRDPSPVHAILEYAKTHDVDLIAMATRGERGAERMVHGSTAAAVSHKTTVPLLLVRE